MLRNALNYFSILAVGAMFAAAIVALMPWLTGRLPAGTTIAGTVLNFDSLVLGMILGLTLGTLTRYNWAEIPRRIVTWFLIRQRHLFYYVVIACCIGVLVFY